MQWTAASTSFFTRLPVGSSGKPSKSSCKAHCRNVLNAKDLTHWLLQVAHSKNDFLSHIVQIISHHYNRYQPKYSCVLVLIKYLQFVIYYIICGTHANTKVFKITDRFPFYEIPEIYINAWYSTNYTFLWTNVYIRQLWFQRGANTYSYWIIRREIVEYDVVRYYIVAWTHRSIFLGAHVYDTTKQNGSLHYIVYVRWTWKDVM